MQKEKRKRYASKKIIVAKALIHLDDEKLKEMNFKGNKRKRKYKRKYNIKRFIFEFAQLIFTFAFQ